MIGDYLTYRLVNIQSSGTEPLKVGSKSIPSGGNIIIDKPAYQAYRLTIQEHYSLGRLRVYRIDTSAGEDELTDFTPPDLSVTSPVESTSYDNLTVTITGSVPDEIPAVRVWYYPDDDDSAASELVVAAGSFSDSHVFSADGAHSMTFVAEDSWGNRSTSRIAFSVDTSAPTVGILYLPDNSELPAGTTEVFVSGYVNDPNAVVTVNSVATIMYAVSSALITALGIPSGSRLWTTSAAVSIPSSPTALVASATDSAGNVGTDTVNVTVAP